MESLCFLRRMRVKLVMGVVVWSLLTACQKREEAVAVELEAVGYEMTVADFHRAAGTGELEVMAAMIAQGVDSSGKMRGDTALHAAARAGKREALGFLLEQGLPVDAVGARGRSPLMVAAEANQVAAVESLMVSGADVALRDDLGYRAMTLAAETGCAEVVEALALRSRENVDDALFLATLKGHAETVEVLVECGASVYARMTDSRTVLMMAAQEGHEEVVRVLLKYGANRYAVDGDGLTAGQIAMEAGQLEVGEFLLEAPAEEEFSFSEIPALADVELREFNVAGEDLEEGAEIETPTVTEDAATASTGLTTGGVSEGGAAAAGPLGVPPIVTGGAGERAALVEMREYHERPLPIRVEGVEGKSVQVRFLYGAHKTVTVQEGEAIPFTGLRVISVQERRRRTKESGNALVDVSAVLVEDPRTGLQRELVTHLAASAHEPFAIVASRDGGNQVARRGALIRSAEGEAYRVLDVRPTQVVLESVATGEVETVSLARRR